MSDAPSPRTTGGQEAAVVLATQGGLLLAGVAIQSLLAHALLPAGVGAYAVCVLFASLLGVLLSPGVDAGAQYFVMARRIGVSQGVSISLTISLAGAGIAAALATPLIYSDVAFFRQTEPGSFFLALILIPLTTFSSAVQHQLAGLRRYGQLALLALIQTIANVLALVLLVVALDLGVDGALIAYAAGNLVMIATCLRSLRRHQGVTWEAPSRHGLTRVLRYGVKYYVARIGWAVDVQAGVLLLGIVAGRTEVGLFAVASTLMFKFLMIANAVSIPLLPRVAGDANGRPELVAFCIRVTIWATGVSLVVLLAVSTPLIRVLLSAAFLPVVPLMRLMAPGILVSGGANVLLTYFRGVNRPEVCSWAVWVGLSANIVTVLLLYPATGVAAGAWGMTAGQLCRSVLLHVMYYRSTRMPLRANWLPRRGDGARLRRLARSATAWWGDHPSRPPG